LLPNNALLAAGGNDDGVIGAISADTANTTNTTGISVAANEMTQYFNQLLAAGLGSAGTLTSADPLCFSGGCATGSPLPPSAYPQSGLYIRYGTHTGTTAGVASPKQAHWLLLTRFYAGAMGGTVGTGAVISAQRAQQLDLKYDDGIAGSGSIRSSNSGDCPGATSYTTDTDVTCNLAFAVE
jgi:hypothetical protein